MCRHRLMFWAGAIALLPATGAGAARVVLELREDVLLSKPGAVLVDVADVYAPTDVLQRTLEQLPVARAPLAGYVESRSRAQLDVWLKSQPALRGHAIEWQGASMVRIRAESEKLPGGRIVEVARAVLESAFSGRYDRLEITAAADVSDVTVPAGGVRLRARPVERLRSRTVVWIDVLAGETVCRSVAVPLTVAAWRAAAVASKPLPDGATLGDGDVEWRPMNVAAQADEPASTAELSGTVRLRRAVAAGDIVPSRLLAPAGMVLRGERLRLKLDGAAVRIELPVVAESDADNGQLIQVRVLPTGNVLTARVMGHGLVRMEGR